MKPKQKIAFIVNPKAGTKRGFDFEKLINKVFTYSDYDFEIYNTQHTGHATAIAFDCVKRNLNYVVAIGGDGTVNEIAKSLVHTSVTLAIVPAGSGNGFARHLKIPLKPKAALQQIIDGKILRCDTFRINNLLSVNLSGFGFEAHVAHLFSKQKGRGLFNYVKVSIGEFLKYPSFEIESIMPSLEISKNVFSVSFANSSQFGNNVRIAPNASVVDEFLDVCFLQKVNMVGAVNLFIDTIKNKADQSKHMEIVKCKYMEIETSVQLPLHIDGEPAGFASKFNVEIVPTSLNVIVPKTTYF